MPRPPRCRIVCCEPEYPAFVPADGIAAGGVTLRVDEFEAIRLVDYEKKTHGEAAAQMGVSRTTVTEIYESAREKIADCLVNGRRLTIAGGHYRLCTGESTAGCGRKCRCRPQTQADIPQKGKRIMRIAVTYQDGDIFQHFGHTEQFKLYDVEGHAVTAQQVVPTNGSGHGALAGFLADNGVDVLICGGIGGGAQTALAQAGIRLYGGVSGRADDAVQALLDGTLAYNPDVRCRHHDSEHGGKAHTCGDHGCGEHTCGGHIGGGHGRH